MQGIHLRVFAATSQPALGTALYRYIVHYKSGVEAIDPESRAASPKPYELLHASPWPSPVSASRDA